MTHKPIITIVLSVLVSLYILPASASEKSHIKVSAQGIATTLPDQAQLSLNFTATALESEDANQTVNASLRDFLRDLEKFELESQSLDTSQINVFPQYDYVKNKRILRGFQVTRHVTFKLNQLDQLESLIKLITSSKLTTIRHISFTHSNEPLLKDEALNNAIRNATRLAETIAEGFNVSLDGIHRVSHRSDSGSRPPMLRAMSMSAEMADESQTYEQKPIEFKAHIDVEFNFE